MAGQTRKISQDGGASGIELDCLQREARTGLPGIGQLGQDSQDRTAKIGLPGQVRAGQEGIGQPGQDFLYGHRQKQGMSITLEDFFTGSKFISKRMFFLIPPKQ
jgi:hypothetical protein